MLTRMVIGDSLRVLFVVCWDDLEERMWAKDLSQHIRDGSVKFGQSPEC